MNFTIDTNILIKACTAELDHIHFLTCIARGNHCIVLDFDSVIDKEYRSNCNRYEFFMKWYTVAMNNSKCFYSGKLGDKVKKELTGLGFHEVTDQTFIAVALQADRCVVSEDSDFGKGNSQRCKEKVDVVKYLQHDLKLTVLDASEACRLVSTA